MVSGRKEQAKGPKPKPKLKMMLMIMIQTTLADPDGRDNARKLVEEGMGEAWQRRWDLSQKGRHTYAFFPNDSSRLRTRWFVATHYRWSRAKERFHML